MNLCWAFLFDLNGIFGDFLISEEWKDVGKVFEFLSGLWGYWKDK
jgi:hypothetical protein